MNQADIEITSQSKSLYKTGGIAALLLVWDILIARRLFQLGRLGEQHSHRLAQSGVASH